MADYSDHIDAMAVGDIQVVGHFRYSLASGRWEWDEELYRIHGYEPGEVDVDLDLILSHKHPEDRSSARMIIEEALRSGGPFSAYQRIVAKDGRVSNIVKVGAGVVDEEGRVLGVEGFYVDVTHAVAQEGESAVNTAVAASAEHRAAIEQAKGMVMVTFNVTPDVAFALLNWFSQNHNIKVSLLAERLVQAASADQVLHPDARASLDRLLHDIATRPAD